jgi:hypothetical protein
MTQTDARRFSSTSRTLAIAISEFGEPWSRLDSIRVNLMEI